MTTVRKVQLVAIGLVVFAIGTCVAHHQFGTYNERRHRQDGGWEVVTYRNKTGDPFEMFIAFPDDSPIIMASGGLSSSGKYHGEWSYQFNDPPRFETLWYWYGEEITEGEWHLRNQ